MVGRLEEQGQELSGRRWAAGVEREKEGREMRRRRWRRVRPSEQEKDERSEAAFAEEVGLLSWRRLVEEAAAGPRNDEWTLGG